jgi:hypothetical protein
VWGGDPSCQHVWKSAGVALRGGSSGEASKLRGSDKILGAQSSARASPRGCFCACGAWKGHLGLEPTPTPHPIKDRCVNSHEHLFLCTKAKRYYFDWTAIQEPAVSDHSSGNGYKRPHRLSIGGPGQDNGWKAGPGKKRRCRDVWTIGSSSYRGAHFATFPPKLVEPCILAGCPVGGTVLDCFAGSGTTGMVALQHGRGALLIERNSDYNQLILDRCEPYLWGTSAPSM